MINKRLAAIKQVSERKPVTVDFPSSKISDFFAENVFTKSTMREYMSYETFSQMQNLVSERKKINIGIANQVAAAMKNWAIAKGASSYCHWFQPLTGSTAEKHDTFFIPLHGGGGIESFSGQDLVQQGPDNNFPSGGLRTTFEARGYTAWDSSSPAFIISSSSLGTTLCIPTIFVSYNGDSLDYKAPLLKSQHFLEMAALPIINLFDRHATRVYPTLGWEQEYFLLDEALFLARPDLVATGRTLVGAVAPRSQEMKDNYFGSITKRVYAYMLDFELEAQRLGIPISTRHNEVAPGQYECAAYFSEANLATDQNQLLMDIMQRVAKQHKFRVLFHEKPYAGVNGSGKHNNWSLATDTGKNLLSPGKTPRQDVRFLTFFINILKAIAKHVDLLRAAVASSGNDWRLGANEAPPAIMSVFIGSTLAKVLDELETRVAQGKKMDENAKNDLKLSIHNRIPDLFIDNTDRNRTSPIAFTGKKFEIRAVGSSANCALISTVFNTIVGQQLINFKKDIDALTRKGKERKDGAILRVLRSYIADCKYILYDGDSYSQEWLIESKKRGLSNIDNAPEALKLFISSSSMQLFEEAGVFTQAEIKARYQVFLNIYNNQQMVEAATLSDMLQTQILPAAMRYESELVRQIKEVQEVLIGKDRLQGQYQLLEKINTAIQQMYAELDRLNKLLHTLNKTSSEEEKALIFSNEVRDLCLSIRAQTDRLELLVADDHWPLPKYRELFLGC